MGKFRPQLNNRASKPAGVLLLAAYPYGVTSASAVGAALAADTRCRLPQVRADWFVAAAARPPLYHDVLQLSATERELEKLLRVDTAENLRQERVVRAGFNSSGVSRNNRLIERHESGHVIYWKSYDFAGNTGRQNLFAHPLGPGTANSFQHDGGEIIFTLPNGLQGYYLADAQGRRLSKGPTAIEGERGERGKRAGLEWELPPTPTRPFLPAKIMLLFGEYEVHRPAPPNVRALAAAMPDKDFIVATGFK